MTVFKKILPFTKGQLISRANFEIFIWTKKWTKRFLYFCLASKMGQIGSFIYHLILHSCFDLAHFRELGQKYKNIFVWFMVQMKTSKYAFEINWPLDLAYIDLMCQPRRCLYFTTHKCTITKSLVRWGMKKTQLLS